MGFVADVWFLSGKCEVTKWPVFPVSAIAVVVRFAAWAVRHG